MRNEQERVEGMVSGGCSGSTRNQERIGVVFFFCREL